MVLEKIAAEFAAEDVGGFDEFAVALPGLGVEELFLFAFGQAFLCGSLFGFIGIVAGGPIVD